VDIYHDNVEVSPATRPMRERLLMRAWLPIPVFLIAAGVLRLVETDHMTDPPYLVFLLNISLSTATSLFVAYVAKFSYERSLLPSLLFMGCGALAFGTASVVAGLGLHYGQINFALSVHNTGVCLAGVFHVLAVHSMGARRLPRVLQSSIGAAAAYTITLTALVLYSYATLEGATPVFYVAGVGPTPVRHVVLGAAVGSFALAAAFLTTSRTRRRSSFGLWYASALALIAVGLFVILISNTVGSPLAWLGRVAQYLGSCYMVVAVLAAYRRSGMSEKALKTALQQSEERLSLAALVVPLGGYSRDHVTGEDYWSPELKAIYGLTPEDPLPQRDGIAAAIHPDDRETVLAMVRTRRTQRDSPEFHMEHRIVRPDGEVRWVLVQGRVVFDDAGRPLRTYGFVLDVTDQKRTELELLESRKLLQEVLENSLDAAYRRDLQADTYDYVSPVVKQVMGLDPQEMRDISTDALISRIHPDDREAVWRAIEEGTVRGSGRVEYRFERSPGHYRWLADYFTVQKDALGRATHRGGIVRDITHQKQIEAALRDSERFTRHVLNNLFAFVGVLELDGTLIEANEAPLTAAGITIDDVRGKKFWDCYWWNYDEKVKQQVREACERAARGEVVRYDVQVRMANDMRMVIDSQIAPLRGADGTITHLIPSAVDVTERAAAEEALRDSELFYRQTLESIPGLVFTTLPDGNCDYQSQQWVDFTGVPMVEHLGDGWNSLLHPDDRAAALAAWRAAVEGRSDYDLEYRVRRYDGEYEWFKVRGRPIRDVDGRIVRWFGAAINIDALKRAETERERLVSQLQTTAASAEQARAQLEAVFQAMVDAVMVLDMDGRILLLNDAMLELCNVKDRAALGNTLDNFFETFDLFGEDRQCLRAKERPAWRVSHGESLENVMLRSVCRTTGKERYLSFSGEPVRDVTGEQILAVVIARDISEARVAEEALRRSHDQLEQRVRERTVELRRRADQLARLTSELTLTEQRERRRLAQVLHDHLQQLLVGANFGLQVLARRVNEDQVQAVIDVQGLINEAINASRSLTVELSPPILHEAGLAAGLEWLARWEEEKHGLHVTLRLDEEAHTDREDVRVLVFQSVRELLFNAVKHAGVSTAHVELAVHDQNRLRVTVRDSGKGFDVEAVMNAGVGVRGGFGLFSIRERLALLGGRLKVESAPGEGAAFHIIAPMYVPIPACLDPHSPHVLPRQPETTHVFVKRSETIRLLIVDDHEVMRQGLSALFADENDIEVVGEAEDGPAAIEQAHRLRPDVILMDFSMPIMDGISATRRICEALPGTRVIGLSMYETSDRAEAMMAAGACAYLTKSGSAEILLDTIRKAASGSNGAAAE
jgi:PAS domain S-box-containing protein